MGVPFVLKKLLVGIDIAEGGWIAGAGGVGAVFGVATIGVLRPEAVEDEGEVGGALSGTGMRIAELGRPGKIEQVVVEAGTLSKPWGRAVGGRGRTGRAGVGIGSRPAGAEQDEKREADGEGRLLHAAQDSR